MNVHYLQHVPFEGLGSIEAWLKEQDHSITVTRLYQNEPLPSIENIDWLIVMGGPMGIEDHAIYPWLSAEKAFIKQALDQKKIMLGICLGAQLIADILGADITKNVFKEIGWFPIKISEEAKASTIGTILPDQFEVFHWHGDTFDIPDRAIPLASSEACRNQGFMINERVIGLQFHLETTPESALDLTIHCKNELSKSLYVQSAEKILSQPERYEKINHIMEAILGYLDNAHTD
ncbi:MAG: type 1 glutamine amidotransferase [Porticoccus sp.]|nr:type 1 glutamine amidotransferase [Porticoccus sp.]